MNSDHEPWASGAQRVETDSGYPLLKRVFDASVAAVSLVSLSLPMATIAAVIRLTSPGPAIHWSRRVGRNNREFSMPKFRTMRVDTPQLATHLMTAPGQYVTAIGRILRQTSLDELPQLYSILKGDMSFVGPRPALFNQDDLVALRTECGIHELTPGLTGWAQVNGRDELPIPVKVELEQYYLRHRSFRLDLAIMLRTLAKALTGEGVEH
jgi:O-antigen biosynthesis protein WbqP